MSFECPQAFFLFLLLPIYLGLDFYYEKKRARDLIPFGNLEVLHEAIKKSQSIDLLKHFPKIIKILIFISLIFAISRPTAKLFTPIKNSKIMLLIDNSISMEAEDIKPTRIDAAREHAKQFVKDIPKEIKIGLGIFSGNVKILLNPSEEKEKVLEALNSLNVNSLEPGTAIGEAIFAGTESLTYNESSEEILHEEKNKILVLITDGEVNIGRDPIDAAYEAKLQNITIQTIGIGNPSGTIIRGGILTRLDESTLKQISSYTGGSYFNAKNLYDLSKIYKNIKSSIKLEKKEKEITFIPASIAFCLLILLQIINWIKFRNV